MVLPSRTSGPTAAARGRKYDPDTAFAAALGGVRFDGRPPASAAKAKAASAPPTPAVVAPPSAAQKEEIPQDGFLLGRDEFGRALAPSLPRLLDGRLLVQGSSGAGKSWCLRRLLEQTARRIQQIVIDPEGEFSGLADHFGYSLVPCRSFGVEAIETLAARVRTHRISVVLDMTQMSEDERMRKAAAFVSSLIDQPREYWHPALVVIDEAQKYAPYGSAAGGQDAKVRRLAITAMADLMSLGRKRGLAGVLATQRLAKLSKSVVSEVSNFLIGRNTLDVDIARAAEIIGWTAQKAERLRELLPGSFVAIGPALGSMPVVAEVGVVETKHVGATPTIEAPPSMERSAADALLNLGGLVGDDEGDQPAAEAPRRGRRPRQDDGTLQRFLVDPRATLATRIVAALAKVSPNAVEAGNLASHLGVSVADTEAALAFLESFGAIEVRRSPDSVLSRLDASLRRHVAPLPTARLE